MYIGSCRGIADSATDRLNGAGVKTNNVFVAGAISTVQPHALNSQGMCSLLPNDQGQFNSSTHGCSERIGSLAGPH